MHSRASVLARDRPRHAIEGKVLQDADRLDAIGAIGIARCMATCAEMKRPFYALGGSLLRERAPDDKAWGIDHFYTKLLRIPARAPHARRRARWRASARAMTAVPRAARASGELTRRSDSRTGRPDVLVA